MQQHGPSAPGAAPRRGRVVSAPLDDAVDTRAPSGGPGDALLARAFQAAPNGFVLVDGQGRIVAVNTALERLSGHSAASLVGRALEVLLPPTLQGAHVHWRQGYFARPEPRAMGAGRVLYARHADGHEFPVEIGLNPMEAPGGALVLASVVDVSERLGLEAAFRGLFDAAPVGLLLVDDDGRIALANRLLAEALGHDAQALSGQPLSRLLPQRHHEAHERLMAGYRVTGEARRMGQGRDLTARHADGSEVPVEIGLSRVRWQRRLMTLAAVTDIGARKRLEQDLRQANADLQEFTDVASHDLRAPLRGIADLVEWIHADLPEPPAAVARNLERIGQRVVRLERLIDELLAYARAGRAAGEPETVDLATLVAGILELQPLPPGFTLERELAVPPFAAARTPLETVLRNLLSNAVRHHDRDRGRLRLSARVEAGACAISLTDDGPGVPAHARARVFRLFQARGARGDGGGGAGIGLALSKRLVETHGGRIELYSPVAEGRGTGVRVWWPRHPRREGR